MKALTSPFRVFNRKRRAMRLRAMLRREKEKETEAKEKEKEGGGGGRRMRRANSFSSSSSSSSSSISSASSSLSASATFPTASAAESPNGDATAAAAETAAETASKEREHEFTTAQEQVFRLLVRSLHVLCYARLAHAACEALVAVAAAATGDAVGALAAGVGALEVAATAKLFWSASAAFDRVISSSGSDIKLLLAGVASAPGSHGLAAMFEKLCHVLELALFLKVAPLALVALAGAWSFLAAGGWLALFFGQQGGRALLPPAELLGSWSVDALREFAAGVGVA